MNRLNSAMKRGDDTRTAREQEQNDELGGGATTDQPHRSGKVNVTGYFDPSVRQSIRKIQAKHPQLKLQDILAEGLNLVFEKYGVPQSAKVSRKR